MASPQDLKEDRRLVAFAALTAGLGIASNIAGSRLLAWPARHGYGQIIVLSQLVSGIVLLIGAFPLLISRLSTFDSPDT